MIYYINIKTTMISNEKIKNIIISQHLLPEDQLSQYLKHVEEHDLSLETYLINNNLLTEEKIFNAIALSFNRPFLDIKDKQIPKEILNIIPSPLAISHNIISFEKSANEINLATTDPLDLQTFEFIHRKTGLEPVIYVTTPSAIKSAQRLYHESLQSELKVVSTDTDGLLDSKQLKKIAEDLP